MTSIDISNKNAVGHILSLCNTSATQLIKGDFKLIGTKGLNKGHIMRIKLFVQQLAMTFDNARGGKNDMQNTDVNGAVQDLIESLV